jgi:hypothetical protein
MSEFDEQRRREDFLAFDLTDEEREELGLVAERLEAERPVPGAAFRGELRRAILTRLQPRTAPPYRLRGLIAAYAGSGFLLLGIAAVGLAGVGPLAA